MSCSIKRALGSSASLLEVGLIIMLLLQDCINEKGGGRRWNDDSNKGEMGAYAW